MDEEGYGGGPYDDIPEPAPTPPAAHCAECHGDGCERHYLGCPVERRAMFTPPAPKGEDAERITAAAIQIGPCAYTGPHHAAIIHYVALCTGMKPVKGEQGFLTSRGRFVDRAWARVLAERAGQVAQLHPEELFSEDLWIVPGAEAALRKEIEELRRIGREKQKQIKALERANTAWWQTVIEYIGKARDLKAQVERLIVELDWSVVQLSAGREREEELRAERDEMAKALGRV